MSQSDPTSLSKSLKLETSLYLQNGDSMEALLGQVQKSCPEILCVVDGYYVKYYKDLAELPKTLIFEHKQRHRKTKVIDYYYRCTISDSLYSFFLETVHDYLKVEEENNCIGRVVEMSSKKKNLRSITESL